MQRYPPPLMKLHRAGFMLLAANIVETESILSLDFSPCQLASGYSQHISILLTLRFYAFKKI